MILNDFLRDDSRLFVSSFPEFGELEKQLGREEIYRGTAVDPETQLLLSQHFEISRLADIPKRFLVFYRRNLNIWYPVYKDALDMWTQRQGMEWFLDHQKLLEKEHTGELELSEASKEIFARDFNRAISDVLKRTTSDTMTGSGTSENNGNLQSSGTNESDTNYSDKNRGFQFAYPESNYTGGVIPYDIDSNPSVEFISSQGDQLSKSITGTSGKDSRTDTTKNTGKTTDQENRTGNLSDNRTGTTADQDNSTTDGTHNRTDNVHWVERETRQGDNLDALAKQLIELLPTTAFFADLVGHLAKCFESVRLPDQDLEELKKYEEDETWN